MGEGGLWPVDSRLADRSMTIAHVRVVCVSSRIHHDNATARKNFSRRRAAYDAEDVTSINERNKNFNKKVRALLFWGTGCVWSCLILVNERAAIAPPVCSRLTPISPTTHDTQLKRAFDKYTVEIRQNLERGTAL